MCTIAKKIIFCFMFSLWIDGFHLTIHRETQTFFFLLIITYFNKNVLSFCTFGFQIFIIASSLSSKSSVLEESTPCIHIYFTDDMVHFKNAFLFKTPNITISLCLVCGVLMCFETMNIQSICLVFVYMSSLYVHIKYISTW